MQQGGFPAAPSLGGTPAERSRFEQAVNGLVRPALAGFRAQATIVRTAAGRLQMQRMSRDAGRGMVVFTSEEEALRHVLPPASV